MSGARMSEQGQPEGGRKTERLRAEGLDADAAIDRAAALIRGGGTVAFPTETVYGLGADALNVAAVEKIFAAKERPAWDPLIVHVDSRATLDRVAVPDLRAERLIAAFWPGPLTLLLPRTAAVPNAVTAGRPMVGVRMPALALARDLIRRAGVPVAAPSANRFGHVSPTRAEHVLADLDGRIDAVLDGGAAAVGVESTVLDMATMTVFRPGAVTSAMIARVVGAQVRTETRGTVDLAASAALPSPGMAPRHYAPRARVLLVRGQSELLGEVAKHSPGDVGVMLPDGWDAGGAIRVFRWGPWSDAEVLARLLFAGLRMLDERGVKTIVCPLPDMDGIGEALRDRLEKAAWAEHAQPASD